MTRICVAGGTGQVGREVVRQAVAGGQAVAVFSRHPPTAGEAGHHDGAEYFRGDVATGEGLAAALAGADVVIDCLEGRSGKALKNLADGGAPLLAGALRRAAPRPDHRRPGNPGDGGAGAGLEAGQGSRGRPVRLPVPGAMGKYLRAGLNLAPEKRHGTETFRGWLAKNADSL